MKFTERTAGYIKITEEMMTS